MKNIKDLKNWKKFWEILDGLDRTTSSYYERQECQKSIFVRRVAKLLNFNDFGYRLFHETRNRHNMLDVEHIEINQFRGIFSVIGITYVLGYGEEITIHLQDIVNAKYETKNIHSGTNFYYDPLSKGELYNLAKLFDPIAKQAKKASIIDELRDKTAREWNPLFTMCYELQTTKKKDLSNVLLTIVDKALSRQELDNEKIKRDYTIDTANLITELADKLNPIRKKTEWVHIVFEKLRDERYNSLLKEEMEKI